MQALDEKVVWFVRHNPAFAAACSSAFASCSHEGRVNASQAAQHAEAVFLSLHAALQNHGIHIAPMSPDEVQRLFKMAAVDGNALLDEQAFQMFFAKVLRIAAAKFAVATVQKYGIRTVAGVAALLLAKGSVEGQPLRYLSPSGLRDFLTGCELASVLKRLISHPDQPQGQPQGWEQQGQDRPGAQAESSAMRLFANAPEGMACKQGVTQPEPLQTGGNASLEGGGRAGRAPALRRVAASGLRCLRWLSNPLLAAPVLLIVVLHRRRRLKRLEKQLFKLESGEAAGVPDGPGTY